MRQKCFVKVDDDVDADGTSQLLGETRPGAASVCMLQDKNENRHVSLYLGRFRKQWSKMVPDYS